MSERTATGFTLFMTPIGRCGIAWGDHGIVALQLPEDREAETRARLLDRASGAEETHPPREIARVVDAIGALLRGERVDLQSVPVDLRGLPPFHQRVYHEARKIAPGETVSYGELAARVGKSGSARAVGQALGRNPIPLVVPCHRVVASGGKTGGFSANGGAATKLRLLSIEGGAAGSLFAGDGALAFDAHAAVEHVRHVDHALARVIDLVGPFELQLKTTSSLFVALTEAIVYQQLTGRAAATILARVRALFPRGHEGPTPTQILRAPDAKLRAAGLSQAKTNSLRDLARRTVSGELPTLEEAHELDDDALVERLTRVKGIGRWTVEMLLMFRLGRPDVLPVDDYGVRKGFAATYGLNELPTPKQIAAHGERWRPYRSVASWYLWRALEVPMGLFAQEPRRMG